MQSLPIIIYSLQCAHKHICLQSGSMDIQTEWYSSIRLQLRWSYIKCTHEELCNIQNCFLRITIHEGDEMFPGVAYINYVRQVVASHLIIHWTVEYKVYFSFLFVGTKWTCCTICYCWKPLSMEIYLWHSHSKLCERIPVYLHPKNIHIPLPFKAIFVAIVHWQPFTCV